MVGSGLVACSTHTSFGGPGNRITAQEELFGHRRGRLGSEVRGLPLEPTELGAGDRRVDPFHRRLE